MSSILAKPPITKLHQIKQNIRGEMHRESKTKEEDEKVGGAKHDTMIRRIMVEVEVRTRKV